jgi:cyclopropane-fatty-acyl-phospholipid synthase
MERVSLVPAGVIEDARPSLWKRLVLSRLDGLGSGELVVAGAHGEIRLGRPAPDRLRVRVTVHRDRLWRRVAMGGLLAATDAYLDGDWDADDLVALSRLFARDFARTSSLDAGLARLRQPLARLRDALARNHRAGARRNIAAHYDLGNDFFARMLDPTMSYSCALFEHDDASLEEASIAKMDRLCRKLDLHAGDRLLEIGSGWGGLAIHAATRYGCRVTTTTISRERHAWATERVREAGLDDRVTVLLADYRDLTGRYSKIVSVEMIEAVGAEYFDTFFRTCADRLVEDGLLAIQAITVADQRFDAARTAPDFIKRHVFPGSCIPSTAVLLTSTSRVSDLRLVHLEDLTPHYARTLAAWRANLEQHRDDVARLTDERFRRLWDFYLAYCEGGFRERHLGLVQMVLARPAWRGHVDRGSRTMETTA